MADKVKRGKYAYYTPVAASRLTKTPITFDDATNAGGNFDPSTNTIGINFPPEGLTLEALGHLLNHEDVHAALKGLNRPVGPPPNLSVADKVIQFLGGPQGMDLSSAMRESGRAGNIENEIPAYMGAYQPGELGSTSLDARNVYVKKFASSLPPEIAAMYMRLVNQSNWKLK